MARSDAAHRPPHGASRLWLATGIGALVGFAIGATVYILLTPILEASDGFVRELQGLSWNLVPGLTLLGGVLGWALARR